MAADGKSTRPEACPARAAKPRANGGARGAASYYPYWLRGKVGRVRRVTI